MLFSTALLGSIEARTVKGRVTVGKKPLSGVIVTDGYGFATTSRSGRYMLEVNDSARFVYMVTPSGYTADRESGMTEFYKKLTDNNKYNFTLIPTEKSADYTLFSISDPQTKNMEHFRLFEGEPLEHICKQAELYKAKGPVVGVMLGDEIWNEAEMLPLIKGAMKKVDIPMYAVIGNHDHTQNLSGLAATHAWEDVFGPANWAFWMGNDLVIGLDNIIFVGSGKKNPKKSSSKYREGYTQRELDFVREILEYVGPQTHIFIAQHSPFNMHFGERTIERMDEMLEILEGRPVDFLSGHSHYQSNWQLTPTIYDHNAPAVCGALWRNPKLGPDGTPNGFEIFEVKGRENECSEVRWHLHTFDFPEGTLGKAFGPGKSRYNPEMVVVNVWDYDSKWKVEWLEDGAAEAVPMVHVKDLDPEYFELVAKSLGPDAKPWKFDYSNHYFGITPSPAAKSGRVIISSRFGESQEIPVSW